MKKLYLILSLACMSMAAYSQKLEKPQVDQITGAATVSTTKETVYSKITFSGTLDALSAWGVKDKETTVLAFYIEYNSGHAESVSLHKNDKVYLKLADNSLVTLNGRYDEESVTNRNKAGHSESTKIIQYFTLSTEDIQKLSNSSVKFIRFQTSAGNYDYELKEKHQPVIAQVVKMIADAKV
jgi:hypothetical protein